MVYARWDGQMAVNGEEKQINYRTLQHLRAMTGSPGYFRIFAHVFFVVHFLFIMESDFRVACRVIPGLEDCTIYFTDVTRSNDEYRLHLTGPLIAASFLIAFVGFRDSGRVAHAGTLDKWESSSSTCVRKSEKKREL